MKPILESGNSRPHETLNYSGPLGPPGVPSLDAP